MKFLIILILFIQISLVFSKTQSTNDEVKLWELRTAPVALLAEWYTLDISYRYTDHFSFGPAIVFYEATSTLGHMFLPTYKGKALGWQANYYFNSIVQNSLYLGIHAYYESYRSYPHAVLGYRDLNGYRSNVTIGYQIKNSNLNFQTGLGFQHKDHQVTTTTENQPNVHSYEFTTSPYVEIKMGIEI